jgi:hypothetical protein
MKSKTIVIFGLGCIVGASLAAAQGFQTASSLPSASGLVSSSGNQPIAVGPFLFSPALQLTWENHSNFWRSSIDQVGDNIYVARLRLLFEMPIRESVIRFSYTPQYRKSQKRVLENNWDHFLRIGGDFEFSNGLIVGANYSFIDGAVSTQEVDPGGELVFNGRRFSKHAIGLNTSYWLNSRDGVTLNFNTLLVDWRGETDTDVQSWFDYTQTTVRGGWLHQLTPTLVMDVSLGYRGYDPDSHADQIRKHTATALTVGFRGQVTGVLSTELRVGYGKTDYSEVASETPGFEDFSGMVINGNVSWALGHGSSLRLDLLRQPFASNYGLNSYYTATGGRLLYDLELGRSFGQVRARLQTNDYNVPDEYLGLKRSDDLKIFGAGWGFRITDKLAVRASYVYEDRDSLDPYAYLNKMWLVDLIFGY